MVVAETTGKQTMRVTLGWDDVSRAQPTPAECALTYAVRVGKERFVDVGGKTRHVVELARAPRDFIGGAVVRRCRLTDSPIRLSLG